MEPVQHPGNERPADPKAAEAHDRQYQQHVDYLMTKSAGTLSPAEQQTLSREIGAFLLKNRE